jgi:hypothetical protein
MPIEEGYYRTVTAIPYFSVLFHSMRDLLCSSLCVSLSMHCACARLIQCLLEEGGGGEDEGGVRQ